MIVRFSCTPALREHMKKKGRSTIVVEVVSSNSDFEITELYIHLVKPSQAEEFLNRKGYRRAELDGGEVLLPPYRLVYDDEVVFDLRKLWIFHSIHTEGIRL